VRLLGGRGRVIAPVLEDGQRPAPDQLERRVCRLLEGLGLQRAVVVAAGLPELQGRLAGAGGGLVISRWRDDGALLRTLAEAGG
jgi:hypothetical protein